jgi:hypothetical protein
MDLSGAASTRLEVPDGSLDPPHPIDTVQLLEGRPMDRPEQMIRVGVGRR